MGTRYAYGLGPRNASLTTRSDRVRTRKLLIWTAVVLIAGCQGKQTKTADQSVSELGSAPSAGRAVPSPYVIAEAGVRFNPPVSWDAARIQVNTLSGKDAAAAQPGAEFAVAFDYRAEQPSHHNNALLNLYVLHHAQWERLARESPATTVIDSTEDWVFVASMPEENPYRSDLLDADQFEAMRLTMDDVRKAFSIEDGGPADPTLRASKR
jgi:hypothetical protein